MTKKIVFGAAIALVIVGIASTPASALCNPPKSLSTYNSGTGGFVYFATGFPVAGTTLVGNVWSGAVNNTGTCNVDAPFVYFGSSQNGEVGLNFNLGAACSNGCPAGSVSVQITAINGGVSKTMTTQTTESVGPSAVNFDFSTTPAHPLGAYPRQHVTASSRVGSNVNVTVGIDAASATAFDGTAGQITGYNVLSAQGATDPGRLASAYGAPIATIPAPGGVAATGTAAVNCTVTANPQFVVTQLVTTGGPSNTVSAATRVNCNPLLANPKYNIVPKKSQGSNGTQK